MSFATVRRTLFTVHMWVGLILGVLLAALGLSGSLLVYDDKIANLLSPAPHAVTAGQPLPLTMIADIARRAAAEKNIAGGQIQLTLPEADTDAIAVRVARSAPWVICRARAARAASAARAGAASAAAKAPARAAACRSLLTPSPAPCWEPASRCCRRSLTFAHQLHGNFLMSREVGRPLVGWLGVAMCILGVTGLVLWWPKRGQWKYAFFVRSTATGLRFHRELHAATGIWIFVVFMAVSFSGVVIAWPQTLA